MTADWRRWVPDVVVATVVGLAGLFELATTSVDSESSILPLFLVVVGTTCAVGLSRYAPGVALALVWVTCGLQALTATPVLMVEVAVGAVAFGTARWGSTATVVLSALSIPAAAFCVVALVVTDFYLPLVDNGSYQVVEAAYRFGDTWQVGAVILGMAVLAVPWLAGLTLRFSERARRSRVSQEAAEEETARAVRETEQAREIARLREEQARLARDVHDVVGHSLAVILAQAESAQYLEDVDTQKLKTTMENIATSARSSLQDVRQVLTPDAASEAPRKGGLDDLVAGVRASGHEVVSTEVGTPQPLPPELEAVAFRVLQEMLTNAIRHGQRDEPVFVERHWPDGSWVGELRIEVRNVVAAAGAEPAEQAGQGLEGMRRRLDAVGGRLDVRRREATAGPTFTVTAWVPVRTVGA